ncbi:Venom serine protease 34 [Armadillidium vulgare]|nr:Venom serine protease 34 [Armadillidium vulgare]
MLKILIKNKCHRSLVATFRTFRILKIFKMGKVILCCFFIFLFVNVSFQRIVEVNHLQTHNRPKGFFECGIKSSSRIVGGSNTDMNEYPWMAALCQTPECNSRTQFCGAALLNGQFIITAAHCIQGMRAAQLSVSLGDHNMNTESETNSKVYQIERIIKHKRYNPRTVSMISSS